jgi:hypothetical protein
MSRLEGCGANYGSEQKKRRIHHYIIVLKGLISKQPAQWYL